MVLIQWVTYKYFTTIVCIAIDYAISRYNVFGKKRELHLEM